MPTAKPNRDREDTQLLAIKPGGTELALPAVDVVGLLAPRNRERDGRAGAFDVPASVETPADFSDYSAGYALA